MSHTTLPHQPDGFLVLSRRFFRRWTWRLPDRQLRLFLWLLYRARWSAEPERIVLPGCTIEVRRGQLWTTRRTLAAESGCSEQAVRTALKLFEREGVISTQTLTHHGTLITVCNYDTYQGEQPEPNPATNQRLTHAQPNKNQENKETKRTEPPGAQYSLGFSRAWELYPHWERRSKKAEAYRRWTKLQLEPLAANVCEHIEDAADTSDWTRDHGRYVPGMQVWLGSQAEEFARRPPGALQRDKDKAEAQEQQRQAEAVKAAWSRLEAHVQLAGIDPAKLPRTCLAGIVAQLAAGQLTEPDAAAHAVGAAERELDAQTKQPEPPRKQQQQAPDFAAYREGLRAIQGGLDPTKPGT